jgi:hypothetical protein
MHKSKICKQHLSERKKLGGKIILLPTEVPGGPKLAMFADRRAMSPGFFWESRLVNDHANISNWPQ